VWAKIKALLTYLFGFRTGEVAQQAADAKGEEDAKVRVLEAEVATSAITTRGDLVERLRSAGL
jgi:hypothetical protein